jgi:ATP-dependent RNA helicase RhlE
VTNQTTFADLGLAAPLLKALETEGYQTPTPIQAQAIPTVMEGKDLLGIAQTGTGKTAAFALPILHRLLQDKRPRPPKGARVLVLSPTRELATQIADSFKAYGRNMGVKVAVVFGGVGHRPQIQALAGGLDVLVATPGRLIDHLDSRHANISGTEIFVLDEADQMLDLGFVRPIRQIVKHLVTRRQNLFFSATMPDEIGKLAGELLKDPVRVAVTPVAKTADRVEQKVIHVAAAAKRHVLTELLSDEAFARTLVFTRTKRGADRVAEHLEKAGISAAAIHGNKSQSQRERALDWFKQGEVRVLVATDIAARGIDISAVSHVVNFELPEVPEAYVHRIGRTARAGAEGQAVSLCDHEERPLLRAIEKLTKQQIPAETRGDVVIPAADAGDERAPRRQQRGRHQGQSRPQQPRREERRGGQPQGQRQGEPQDKRQDGRQGAPQAERQQRPASPARKPQNDNRPQQRADERPTATTGGGFSFGGGFGIGGGGGKRRFGRQRRAG